jgi:hypothetical protein
MSQKNVEAFKRGLDAGNRRDIESFLETLDPEVEWHPGLAAPLKRGGDGLSGKGGGPRDVSGLLRGLR